MCKRNARIVYVIVINELQIEHIWRLLCYEKYLFITLSIIVPVCTTIVHALLIAESSKKEIF